MSGPRKNNAGVHPQASTPWLSQSVSKLHRAVAASRRTLLRAQCLARVVDPSLRAKNQLRRVRRFRSTGVCHLIEVPFIERARLTFDKNAPAHAISSAFPFCPPLAYEHQNLVRQRRVRVQYLRAHRLKYKHKLANKEAQRDTASNRIAAALADLERLTVQQEQVENGAYCTEREFMTKRQIADNIRESLQFRTTSVHAFGQSLDLDGAKPALELALRTARRDLEKFSIQLERLLTRDPLVLHHVFALAHWWKSKLRQKSGRKALTSFRRRIARARASEERYWLKIRQTYAATTIENAWRAYQARCCLWRLWMARRQWAAACIQCWWRHCARKRYMKLLRRIATRFLHRGRAKMLWAFRRTWWKWVLRERRREWLERFARMMRLHFAAIRLQRRVRFYLRIGRGSFRMRVTSKLHFTVRRLLSTSSPSSVSPSSSSPLPQSLPSLSLTRWELQRLLLDLDELQTRARRLLHHGELFFKGELHRKNKEFRKLYKLFAAGQRAAASKHWIERFRGIGDNARPGSKRPPSRFSFLGWAQTRFPESFEWLVLQKIDRRFRANQVIVDAVTEMFDAHGEKLDHEEHRLAIQTLLRSLDPTQVHDVTVTEATSEAHFFAWHFAHIGLCATCSCMIVRDYQACSNCGKGRHERKKISMTYSMILQEPARGLKQENKEKDTDKDQDKNENKEKCAMSRNEASIREEEEIRAVADEAKRVALLHQKTESRRVKRVLPESVSAIHLASEPFLYHANFWATAPRRHGKGRSSLKRSDLWDTAVLEAKNSGWIHTLVRTHGVTTVGKLSLWSMRRLREVAGLPENVARRIMQLMGLLRRELRAKRWRSEI